MDIMYVIIELFRLFVELFARAIDSLPKFFAFVTALGLLILSFTVWTGAGNVPQATAEGYIVIAWASFISAVGILTLLVVLSARQENIVKGVLRYHPQNVRATIADLRRRGKLSDLQNPLIMANCSDADLHGVDLHEANLRLIVLQRADLHNADLSAANLRSAHMKAANLRDSDLRGAVLRYADLENADLRNALLNGADLTATNLSHARLQGAVIDGACFDPHTTLPDGRTWTPDMDLSDYGVA